MRIKVFWLALILGSKLTNAQVYPTGDTLISFQLKENSSSLYYWKIEKGKWGILDSTMRVVVPCSYDYPYVSGEYYDRYFGENCDFDVSNPVILCSDSLSDLVDLETGVVSPSESFIVKRIDSYFVYRNKRHLYGLIGAKGEQVLPPISYTNIEKVFDSLFLMRNGDGFFLMNTQNKVVLPAQAFTDTLCYALIADLVRSGILENRNRFDFEIEHMTDKEISLALLYFNNHYLQKEEESLMSLLSELCDKQLDFCEVIGCFRYLSAELAYGSDAYQVDIDCGQNIYSTMDGPYYRIRGLGSGIVEFRNDALMASNFQVYLQLSNYTYYKMEEGKLKQITWQDLFRSPDSALFKVNRFVDSLIQRKEDEILMLVNDENRQITDSSNYFLGDDGLVFLLYYLDEEKTGYPDSQYELLIPYPYLKQFIGEDSLLFNIVNDKENNGDE